MRTVGIVIAVWLLLPRVYYYSAMYLLDHTNIADNATARYSLVGIAKVLGVINIWPIKK